MGTHILEAFIITFGLDPKGFEEGSRRVDDESRKLQDRQKKLFDGIEDSGRKAGGAIKGLSREVIGLGVAFLGARSIVGFMANIASSAATADRFGKIVGMSTERVYAWREAMKSVGGNAGDADAAMQTIQNTRMGLVTGQPDAQALGTYARLGITAGDLRNGDAGSILSKLAGAKERLDPQLYANLLQQIGLPASTISLLMQGKGSVDQLIAKFEADTEGMKKAAEEQKKLQEAMASLESALTGLLVPALNEIIPLLTALVTRLGGVVERKDAVIGAAKNAYVTSGGSGAGAVLGGLYEAWTGGSGKTRADRNHNPGNIVDSAWTRKQPGYVGSDGRFARFASPDHGFAAMEKLLGNYMSQGRTSISSILSKYAPSSENDVGAYASHVSKLTGFGLNQPLRRDQIPALARAMAKHEGYSFKTNTAFSGLASMQRNIGSFGARGSGQKVVIYGGIHIKSNATDAKGIARDIHGALNRRAGMVSADRVVNP